MNGIMRLLAAGTAGVALAAGAALGGAGAATASTNGCLDAQFTCGDLVQAAGPTTFSTSGLVYGALRAGAPVTAGQDLAASAGTDWKIISDGPTTAIEAAPGGRPSGLYLGTDARQRVVLKPFSAGWDVHWEAEKRAGGTVYVNDMTGYALSVPRSGQQLVTGHAGVYTFRGHIAGS
jgi:hypothetical protein